MREQKMMIGPVFRLKSGRSRSNSDNNNNNNNNNIALLRSKIDHFIRFLNTKQVVVVVVVPRGYL